MRSPLGVPVVFGPHGNARTSPHEHHGEGRTPFYYGHEDWDWKTFEAQAPSQYQTIEEYAAKSYNSHL